METVQTRLTSLQSLDEAVVRATRHILERNHSRPDSAALSRASPAPLATALCCMVFMLYCSCCPYRRASVQIDMDQQKLAKGSIVQWATTTCRRFMSWKDLKMPFRLLLSFIVEINGEGGGSVRDEVNSVDVLIAVRQLREGLQSLQHMSNDICTYAYCSPRSCRHLRRRSLGSLAFFEKDECTS